MQKRHCPYDAVWTAFAVVVLSLVFAVGCSSEVERPPSLGNSGDKGTSGVQTGPCKDGWQRHCSETLGQEGGVLTCWEGRQYCENGLWSACLEGELTHRPDPTAKANRPYIATLSISSAPVACLNNPCDPTCMWWDEDPSPDLVPTGVVSGNPTYSGLPAASVCSHDICSTGAALDATCSACVTTVCSNATYASCCDSSVANAWNQTCVDAAYTLCQNQPPPLGLCDFGLYSTGAVVGADRVSAGVAIGSNTSVTLGVDSSPSRILVNGNLSIANGNGNPIVAPNGIIATGNISVAAGNSKITGTVQAGGSVTLNSGVTVTGNVWARTNITGQATGTINGTGYAGGTVDPVLTVTSRVNGSTHAAPVVTVPTTIPTKAVTCSTNAADNRSVSGSTSVLTLPPGNYNTVSVSNDATLVLSAEGTYTFNSLSVNTGKIKLGAAFTTVGYDVDICNAFTLRGQSSYNEIQDSTGALLTTPSALRIYVNGSGAAVDMGPDVQFVGVLRAPNGAVNKGDRGTIKGAIWSKSMSLGTDQYATGMSEAECDALNLGGEEPVVACPGQNTTPAVPPALNEPCNTGLDCQMNNRCVEPRTVGGSHSKCLEGAALSASQGDACVAKICAADPTCCSTAWTPACVAKVATVCDAVCGAPSGCLHQACTTGSPLQTTCDSCINTICSNAATAYCCSTTWDATCVAAAYAQCGGGLTPDRAVPGVSLCDYAGYAKGSATALATLGTGLEATVTGGTFGGLGAVNLTNAKIYGDAFAVGSFAINTVTITGKTYSESTAAPTVTALTGSAPIYPVTIPRPTTPTISWGTAPYSCSGGSAASGSPAPGNFGATTVAVGNTLTLSAGTYTFSSLTVNGTLALPATGQVKLIVCGAVTFGTGGKMTGLTDATALNLEIYAQNNVSLKSGTKLYGFVFSSTDITIDQDTTSPTTLGTTLKGMALSNSTINVKTKSKLDYDNLRSSCISKGFGTNPTTSVSSPERLCSYSTYGTTSVVTAGNQYIRGGNLGSAGTVSLGNATSRTTVDGNLFARGNVTLTGAAVLGDVRTTGTITSSGTTTVYGTQTPPGTDKVPNPTAIPNPTFTCGSAAQTFNGTTGSIAPGSYGALSMSNWANVTLSAGTYYFSSVDVQSNAKFTLPITGVVKLYVCGQAKFGQIQPPVNLSTTLGSDWLRFQIYSASTLSTLANPAIYVSGGSGNPMYGVMVAPNGMVGLSNASKLNGLAWGSSVQLDTSALVDSIGAAGTSCEAYAIDSAPACPVTWAAPTPPNESAVCTANATGATGYKDATCPGYDLALGLACGSQVAVCNHGSTGFTGPLDVYYFAYGDRQMSTPTPIMSAKDGTCSTASITIPAGYCTNLACTLPAATSAAPYTLMVGPTTGASALSECSATNPRNLDNWSIYDGRSCSAGTGNLTREESYVATCSVPGSQPRWDRLTWNADIPGSSTIEFWGRTGATAAQVASATYALISTATTTNQICALSGPTGCPVSITKALALNENNQGAYLDLKMVLKSSGASTPTLKDWKVRYSCVYDE